MVEPETTDISIIWHRALHAG